MSAFKCCFMLLQLNALAVLLSGTGIPSTFVCTGDSVQLFQNIKFDSLNANGSLGINGDRTIQIANWTVLHSTLNVSILPEYKDKVHLNINGTILLDKVHRWDEAKYMITNQADAMFMTDEVHIFVMDAPANDCRPNIMQLGNSLIATLEHNVCGRPVATTYWKDCCGVSNSSEPMIKLTPGKEACTCYACIVSPALNCARNSMQLNHCSTFSVGGTNSPRVSLETGIFIVVGIILGISLLLVIAVMALLIHRRKKSTAHKRYKESNESDNMQPLLEGSEIQSAAVVESDDQEHKTKETTPEYLHRTDSGITEKTQVPPETPLCKICGLQKIKLFTMPCNHTEKSYIPTCTDCSTSLTECELCKRPIEKNLEYQYWVIL